MVRYAVVVIALSAAWAAAAPQPTLSLDFDQDFTATTRAGAVKPELEGQPTLVDGRFGKAMKSGPGSGYLKFATAGILSPEQGTVELWVCPIDWDGTEEKFHCFFDMRCDQGVLYLYKYYQGGLLMLSGSHPNGPYASAPAPIGTWKPGQWHHIAGTWSRGRQEVFVDGKRIAGVSPNLPTGLSPTFTIGDHPWHIPRTSSSLIDRVRIYDRALSEAHIAAHLAGDYDKTVPIAPQSLDLGLRFNLEQMRLTAHLSTTADDTAGAQVAFSLRGTNARPEPAEPQSLGTGIVSAAFGVTGLAPGAYDLVARVTRGGQEVCTHSRPFHVPDLSWRGNQLGRADVVLAPWTPLQAKADGDRVELGPWGRRYTLGAGAAPQQIESAGKPLLAGAGRLIATVDGQPLPVTGTAAKLVASSPTRATIESEAQAGPLKVRAKVVTEYDGLMLTTLTFEGGAAARLDSLTYELPVREDVALYRHRWARAWAGETGSLPRGEGVIDKSSFLPYAWLGDNDRGLFWFCESSQGWPNRDAADAFVTERRHGQVVWRFNLLAKGQQAPTNWTWEFGLQGTPVKPLARDWRKWRMHPAPKENIYIYWPTPQPDSQPWFGYPAATKPEIFGPRVKQHQAKGGHVVPYSCLSFFSGASPEWTWFEQDWTTGGGDAGSSDVAAYGAVFEMINPRSQTFQDFIVWKNVQFLKQFNLDGYYHDNTHPYEMSRIAKDCGWQDEKGQWRTSFPILAYRDLYRRLYAAVREVRPDAWLMAHMSGKVTIPILAYEDAYLDGEHFRGVVKDNYLDHVSLDAFRAEYMGRQWGLMPYFLPEFDQANQASEVPTRGLMALLMLHDVQVWGIWCHAKPVKDMYEALDAFGYVDSEFIGYFDAKPPARTALADVLVSAWRKPDGQVLAVVGNLSRQPRQGTITFDAQRLGVRPSEVVTWPAQGPVTGHGASVEVSLAAQSYQLLRLK